MADVATALKTAIMNCVGPENCAKCEYRDIRTKTRCKTMLLRDALELLDAQQKTPVVFKQFDGSIESECGNCGLYLDKTYSVCPKCGKGLNWNA